MHTHDKRQIKLFGGRISIPRLQGREPGGSWVNSEQAGCLFASLICLNAVYIGMETELRPAGDGFSLEWFLGESFFLMFFTLELGLRVKAERWQMFKDTFNLLDIALVLTGILDTWVIELFLLSTGTRQSQDMTFVTLLRVVRLLRLVRILRLVRLLRYIGELLLLLKGIFGAMRALVWSLLLIVLVVYATGVFLTKLLGHRLDLQDDEEVQEWFGSIWSSMFTLFQMITLEGWNDVARYTMKDTIAGPGFVLLTIGFILFTNLTLLNLVTGIILDHVMTVSREQQRTQSAKVELVQAKTTLVLQDMFLEMDQDDDGEITLEDLRRGVEGNEEIRRELLKLEVGILDIDEIFAMLDLTGSGSINAAEFVDGLMRAVGPASAKHLLGLHFDLFKMWQHLLDQLQLKGQSQSRGSRASSQSSHYAAGGGEGAAMATEHWLEHRLAAMEHRLSEQLDKRFSALAKRLERSGQLEPLAVL